MGYVRTRVSDLADGDGTAVLVVTFRSAGDRAADCVKDARQCCRGLLATPVKLAIFASTELIGLGRVYPPQSYTRPVDFYHITVDHAGATYDVFCDRWRNGQQHGYSDEDSAETHHGADAMTSSFASPRATILSASSSHGARIQRHSLKGRMLTQNERARQLRYSKLVRADQPGCGNLAGRWPVCFRVADG